MSLDNLVLVASGGCVPFRGAGIPPSLAQLLNTDRIKQVVSVGNTCAQFSSTHSFLSGVAPRGMFTAVRGEFDTDCDKNKGLKDLEIVDLGQFKAVVLNGYQIVPRGDTDQLLVLRRKYGVNLVLTGDSSESYVTEPFPGMYILCPGSLCTVDGCSSDEFETDCESSDNDAEASRNDATAQGVTDEVSGELNGNSTTNLPNAHTLAELVSAGELVSPAEQTNLDESSSNPETSIGPETSANQMSDSIADHSETGLSESVSQGEPLANEATLGSASALDSDPTQVSGLARPSQTQQPAQSKPLVSRPPLQCVPSVGSFMLLAVKENNAIVYVYKARLSDKNAAVSMMELAINRTPSRQ